MSSYTPSIGNASKIHVYLGYVNLQANMTSGSGGITVVPSGFSFMSSDVGNPIMVFGAGPGGAPLWSTVTHVRPPGSGTLADNASTTTANRQVVIFRELKPAGPYIALSTMAFDESISNRPTFKFTARSDDGSFIPSVGQAVLVIHSDTGDLFGGSIDHAKAINTPGQAQVDTECECVSWDQILTRRLIVMTGAFPLGGVTETFQGPSFYVDLSHYPSNIYSIKTNGVAQTFGTFPDGTVEWWWALNLLDINQVPGPDQGTWGAGTTYAKHDRVQEVIGGTPVTFQSLIDGNIGNDPNVTASAWCGYPLLATDTVVVNYDYPGATGAAPSYSNMTAAAIVTALAAMVVNEGVALGSVVTGPTVDALKLSMRDTVASALTTLCQYISNPNSASYRAYVDERRRLQFEELGVTRTAPWNIDESDNSDGNVLIQVSNQITREKFADSALVEVTGAVASESFNDNFAGTGSSESFNTTFPIFSVNSIARSISSGGGPEPPAQVVKANGPPGAFWYYVPGTNTIFAGTSSGAWDALIAYGVGDVVTGTGGIHYTSLQAGNLNHAIPLGPWNSGDTYASGDLVTVVSRWFSSTTSGNVGNNPLTSSAWAEVTPLWWFATAPQTNERLDVTYQPEIALTQTYIDSAIASARAAIESGTGEYDSYLSLSNSLPFALVSGLNVAASVAALYSALSRQTGVQTYRPGLRAGQSITVNLPEIGAVGDYTVDQVRMVDSDGAAIWTVTLATGAIIGDYRTAFKAGLAGGGGSISAVGGGGGGGTPSGPVSVTSRGANVTY